MHGLAIAAAQADFVALFRLKGRRGACSLVCRFFFVLFLCAGRRLLVSWTCLLLPTALDDASFAFAKGDESETVRN